MKQILPELKELNKHLSFAKNAFTKNGFRHFQHYIDGLITINKKTVRQKGDHVRLEKNEDY